MASLNRSIDVHDYDGGGWLVGGRAWGEQMDMHDTIIRLRTPRKVPSVDAEDLSEGGSQ